MRPILLSLLLATAAPLTQAQAPTDPIEPIQELSRCLADNTSGKDRKDLARWGFFAMAAHPEIKQYVSPDLVSASDEINKTLAATFTRLLVDSCPAQTHAAFKQGGSNAIDVAFQSLGQLAMQELVSNQDVRANMTKFEKLLDLTKLQKVMAGG
ncbi:hypothetical protein [Hydrogenophaga taeniospiralis]|uniref:hypothetical protein n=1 Tax=Hydrogenophaga taeniospiralis TaxID=65656 RepID=UPI001CFB4516|nr:hypothetical protein [Hydrogenophaga taeniospiralis]UCU95799.1 hypothetical protein KI616_08140 [Hydrogenophaga taeniospiralis]